ncbi:MAG: peptidylprolyl isomerase [Cyanobacteria bacterium J06642_2]
MRRVVLWLVTVLAIASFSLSPADAKNLARSPRQAASWLPGSIPATAVNSRRPPDDIRAKYPWLDGQATVRMQFTGGLPFEVTVYGDHAPVTAGNFIDLASRGFYDGAELVVDKPFLLKVVTPEYAPNQTPRNIPLEIQPEGSAKISYGETFRDSLIDDFVQPVLKNSFRGSIALSHPVGQPNAGSTQLMISYGNGQLIPFNGNELDGNYAVFAYIAEGINYREPSVDVLENVRSSDRLEKVEVISGLENLHRP